MVHFAAFRALSVESFTLTRSVFVVFTVQGLATVTTVSLFWFVSFRSVSALSDSTDVGSLVDTSLGTGGLFCGDIVEEGGQVLHCVEHGLGHHLLLEVLFQQA